MLKKCKKPLHFCWINCEKLLHWKHFTYFQQNILAYLRYQHLKFSQNVSSFEQLRPGFSLWCLKFGYVHVLSFPCMLFLIRFTYILFLNQETFLNHEFKFLMKCIALNQMYQTYTKLEAELSNHLNNISVCSCHFMIEHIKPEIRKST